MSSGPAASFCALLLVSHHEGLTLVHFSAQPEPFLTQNTPQTPPATPCHPLIPPDTS